MSRTLADASELLAYAHQLEHSVTNAEPELSKVVERGALNVKRGAQTLLRSWSQRHYLKHYYRSLSYDMDNDGLGAEIGPDSAKLQGGMGRGVELGSANTRPSPHLFPAFDMEAPRFEEQAARALRRALR